MIEPDDATVIRKSLDWPDAFAELFRRHAAHLTRYVTRRLGADVADDIVGDTFLIAFGQRVRYDTSRPNARPWLYGIATNLISRHRRSEVRQLRAFARSGFDPVLAGFTDCADARVGAQLLKADLADALSRLKSEYRDTLLLVVWGEMTYEEAGAALGVPMGTVRSRMNRARKKLQVALGGADPTAYQEDFR